MSLPRRTRVMAHLTEEPSMRDVVRGTDSLVRLPGGGCLALILPSLEGCVTGNARLDDHGIWFLSRWCCGAAVRGASALTAV